MSRQETERVLDFGAHLHPPEAIPEEFANRPLTEHIGAIETDPEAALEWYQESGIDSAVLSQPYFMGHEDAELTARGNDVLLEIVETFDEFYGLGAIPVPAGGDAAGAEFERCLDNGYHGGALETKSAGITLTDSAVEPVLEVADQTGAPIFVHPKIHESLHPDTLDDRFLLNATIGREAALMESICSVIHDDVFASYPNLNLVYHHLGGNIGSMMGRIDLQLDEGRWPGRQGHVKDFDRFRAELDDHIYVDTAGFFAYHTALQATLEELPIENIVMGTDAPYEPRTTEELASFVEVIEDKLSPTDKRKLLWENAMDLLINT